MNFLRYSGCIILGSLLSSGCSHKQLCYNHPHYDNVVEVVFDWEEYNSEEVEGMRVIFYPESGAMPIVENLRGRDGGRVYLPEGTFHVVSFNNDTEAIRWRGESELNSLEAYTRESSITDLLPGVGEPPRAEAVVTQPIVLSPDRLWRATASEVTVASNRRLQQIVLHPAPATRHISYEFRHVTGGENVRLLRGSLSDMWASYFPLHDAGGSQLATFPFGGELVGDSLSQVVGEFDCWGCPLKEGCRHVFTLYFWSAGGNIASMYDVTEQIHTAEDPFHIHLVIEGSISIPEAIGSGEGFSPEVEEWEDNYGTLFM